MIVSFGLSWPKITNKNGMKRIIWMFAVIMMLATSCKEYVPYVSCRINGTAYRIEQQVSAQYISNGSTAQCFVQANGTPWSIIIRTNMNVQGTYSFGYSTAPQALIEFYDGSQLFTSNYLGTSGSVELIQVGSSLVEGYFSGSLQYGSSTLTLTQGEFTSRAY